MKAIQTLPPFPVLPERFSRDCFHDGISGIVAGDLSLDVTNPFVAIDERFEGLLTDSAEVRVVAKQEGRAFAHEAGVWVEETQEVWFTSNLYSSGSDVTVEVSKFNCSSHEVQKVTVPHVKVGNGACRSTGGIVFCEQGGLDSHSQLVLVDVSGAEPKSRVLLNNFQGRRFNSLNDVIAHPSHFNSLWFTDPTYGHEQGFRPDPQLPPQVYEFNTTTGVVRVVADGFDHPNGICFSPDGTRCYITDTGHIHGSGRKDPTKPSTM
jgi:gluconolactonase